MTNRTTSGPNLTNQAPGFRYLRGAGQDAVAMRLAVIGESARHINDVTERRLPEIPFSQIAGMRHRIAHDYQKVNFRIVWEVATK